MKTRLIAAGKRAVAVLAVAVAGYGSYVGYAWYRFGNPAAPSREQRDPLLDHFMPAYDIVERHDARVAAPAAITLDVARALDLQGSPVVRTIIRAREILLRAAPDRRPHPRGLLEEVQFLGWGVLADVPGREVVVGAVTKPWEPNVVFRALPPDRFAAFDEPGYVKIAWTLRADAIDGATSIFRTETRAIATDADARARFRRYWSLLSPGIIAIRWAVVRPVTKEAERRARPTST